MNINEQMRDLGEFGAGGYSASDDVVERLLSRTRRARTVRQGTTALASSVSAAALALVTVQAVSGTEDAPAHRNGEIVEKVDHPPAVGDGDGQFSDLGPTGDEVIEDEAVIEHLEAASKSEEQLPEAEREAQRKAEEEAKRQADEEAQRKAEEEAKRKAEEDAAAKKKAKEEAKRQEEERFRKCVADHENDNKPGARFDCRKNTWVAENGYFFFGDGELYKIVTWVDAATGKTRTGNFSKTYQKIIFADPANNYYDSYKQVGENAVWDGSTCTGVTTTQWGAPHQYSCLHTDGGTEHSDWFLLDDQYRWLEDKGQYFLPSNPPADWLWDGIWIRG